MFSDVLPDRETWIRQKYEQRKFVCPFVFEETEREPAQSQTTPSAEQTCYGSSGNLFDSGEGRDAPEGTSTSEGHLSALEPALEKSRSGDLTSVVPTAVPPALPLAVAVVKRKASEPPALAHTSSDSISRSGRPRSTQFSQSLNVLPDSSDGLVPSKSVGSDLSLELGSQSVPIHSRNRASTTQMKPQSDLLLLDETSPELDVRDDAEIEDIDERKEQRLFVLAHDLSGDLTDVMHLIICGTSVNWKNPQQMGRTPLHEAVVTNNLAYAEALLMNGADVCEADVRGWTPLHAAAYLNRLTMAKALLGAYGKQTATYIAQTDARGLTAVGKGEEERGIWESLVCLTSSCRRGAAQQRIGECVASKGGAGSGQGQVPVVR